MPLSRLLVAAIETVDKIKIRKYHHLSHEVTSNILIENDKIRIYFLFL